MSDNKMGWFARFDMVVSKHVYRAGEYCGMGAGVVVNTVEEAAEVAFHVTQVDDFMEGCEKGYQAKRMSHLQAKMDALKA